MLGIILLVHAFIKSKDELRQVKVPGRPFNKRLWRDLFNRRKEIKYGFYSLGTAGVFGSIYYIGKLLK